MARINLNPQNPKQQKRFKTHNYSNENSVSNLARYVLNEEKTPSNYKSFYGVPNASPECIENSFATIAAIHQKDMHQRRKAEHFVLSFDAKDELTELGGIENALKIINEYCKPLADDHQVFCAVHEDKKHLHAHIVLNPINYHNGKRLQKNRTFLNDQRKTVDSLVEKYKNETINKE